jgi:hypothetical protein
MAFTAVVPMSSPSATFTPCPPRPGPESTFPVLILRRAAAPGQFTSACSVARSPLAQCGRGVPWSVASCAGILPGGLRESGPNRCASCSNGYANPRIAEPVDLARRLLRLNKCSPRPGTFLRRGTSREPGGQSWSGEWAR